MSLARFAGRDQADVAGRAALFSSALQSRGPAALQVIFGAGLIAADDGSNPRLEAVAFVNPDYVDEKPTDRRQNLRDVRVAFEVARQATGYDADNWLGDIRAWVLPPPLLQISPGARILASRAGTIGCEVSWASGTGFLTAGHVAGVKGHDVLAAKRKIGTVEYVNDPRNCGTAPQADIGIVSYASGVALSPPPALSGATVAGANSAVTVHTLKGASAQIMGYCSFIYLPSIHGTLGDTYFTTASVTAGGDSGCAVSSGNGIVGLVVAGTTNFTTYIQDIHYLLGQAGSASSGLTGLSV